VDNYVHKQLTAMLTSKDLYSYFRCSKNSCLLFNKINNLQNNKAGKKLPCGLYINLQQTDALFYTALFVKRF